MVDGTAETAQNLAQIVANKSTRALKLTVNPSIGAARGSTEALPATAASVE